MKSWVTPDRSSPKLLRLWALGYCQSYSFLSDLENPFYAAQQSLLHLSILQLGNDKTKIVMPWDPVKYLGVRLTITGDLTFERDYVRKKTLNTIKQLTKHM